jgi:hypothetical protein
MTYVVRMKSKIIAAALLILAAHTARAESKPNFVVHEWGTFTSVQGGDGELLSWRPLQTSELPDFVYNWSKPGLNRYSSPVPNSAPFASKVAMVTLQRMETPVIYFYSDKTMSVDVSVGFPKGLITEWYPQASQIGPSLPAKTNVASGALSESRAIWKNLLVAPEQTIEQLRLPTDKSGGHYFAARKTGADVVQTTFMEQGKTVAETDKFIFYRGAGSFKTPLHVSVDRKNSVVVKNTGSEKLSGLFLISIHKTNNETYGAVTSAKNLAGEYSLEWPMFGRLAHNWKSYPLAEFQAAIIAQMEAALISEGLFPDEAKAMVNTWKDSWFTEEGERVLYILPRAWTDETLPMTLNPKPELLVRVMVGRAEIIMPDVEMNLFQVLTKAQNGDAEARPQAAAQLKQLGRFAEPALQLANHHSSRTNVMNLGFELLNNSAPSKFE